MVRLLRERKENTVLASLNPNKTTDGRKCNYSRIGDAGDPSPAGMTDPGCNRAAKTEQFLTRSSEISCFLLLRFLLQCFLEAVKKLRVQLDAPNALRDKLAEGLKGQGCGCWSKVRGS